MIKPTSEELAAGAFEPEHLYLAVNDFYRDGFLVMEGVEDIARLDKIRDFLLAEAPSIREVQKPHRAEKDKQTGNILQAAPTHLPELQSHLLHKNPFVLQVVNAYLGPRPQLIYTAGNNAIKRGTERQRVHKDNRGPHPYGPYLVAAQTVLCDFTPETGATEIWPGSHLTTTNADQEYTRSVETFIKDEVWEERAKHSPPLQVPCKYGGVFLRDMRLWHAGMPNHSDQDRIMLACGYAAQWYQCTGTVKLPKGVEHLYESNELVEVMAEVVDPEAYAAIRHEIAADQFSTKLDLPGRLGKADLPVMN